MIKKLLIGVLVAAAFLVGYGHTAKAIMGRNSGEGYFFGTQDTSGDYVFRPYTSPGPTASGCSGDGSWAIPYWVYSKQDFINYIFCKLNSNATYNVQREDRTGAAFVIQSMRGAPGYWACGDVNNNCRPDQDSLNDWVNRINNPDVSVNWDTCVSWSVNSLYQGNPVAGTSTPNDDTFYNSSSSSCNVIVFSWSGGNYIIKRFCGNPVINGEFGGMPLKWAAQGTTTVSDSNDTNVAGNITTQPGDTVTFTHSIQNLSSSTDTSDIWYQVDARYTPTVPWTAQYYNNTTLSGSPVLTRTENIIDYRDPVGNLSPAPGVNADGFSARWTKTENFPTATTMTMKVDDGGRLYVDGTLVLNFWIAQGATSYNVGVAAGTHTIVMEYYEGGGPGWATLDYTNQNIVGGTDSYGYRAGQVKTVVPAHSITVPLNAAPGTQYCERILWDYKNSWAGGDYGTWGGHQAWADMACAIVSTNDLTPSITASINGTSGNFAEPGDTVTFNYGVANALTVASGSASCTYNQAAYTGYNSTAPTTPFTPSGASCPPSRTFPASATTSTAIETINSVPANTSLCRSITVSPAAPDGSTRTAQACVYVVSKPFAKVYGGDVAAGAGVVTSSGTCSSNNGAAIIGWNKGGAPNNYEGAGVQYAAYALNTILGVATSTNGSGAAATPAGLGFANTATNLPGGAYGGGFGSVPCIPDYFSRNPSAPNLGSTLSGSLTSGNYYRSGSLTISASSIAAGNRVSIFVSGDVYISGPITYGGSGSWSTSNIPLFQLVASGNIYIAPGVSQLDGMYVAQSADGVSNGVIYTCATGLAAPVALGSLAASCGTQLTVNGGFVARQVQLMRTAGSLGNGTPAEVFNFNPALWIAQPSGLVVAPAQYDAITSLPPVL